MSASDGAEIEKGRGEKLKMRFNKELDQERVREGKPMRWPGR
jgi:hypothetical protein